MTPAAETASAPGRQTARIDLRAVAANWRTMAALSGSAQAAAVVKADAYGLGADRVGVALANAGCRRFYVAWPHEGLALRTCLGPGPEIAVFHGPVGCEAWQMRQAGLEPVLNSPAQVRAWIRDAPGGRYSIHLDTGMNRLGLSAGDWASAAELAPDPVRVISHLACADDAASATNRVQLERFVEGAGLWPEAGRSLSATGGILLGRDFLLEETRPGISLYGGGSPQPIGISPVLRLSAPVLQVRDIGPGDTVGYASSYRATHAVRGAVIAAGYADGFLRSGSSRAFVSLCGDKRAVLGRISMDLIVADATGLDVSEGDEAVLIGDASALGELAEAMGTIDYELLTRIAPRAVRVYMG